MRIKEIRKNSNTDVAELAKLLGIQFKVIIDSYAKGLADNQ